MRKLLAPITVLLVVVPTGLAVAATPKAVPTPKLTVAATITSCTTGSVETERALRVTSTMPTRSAARSMAMRFTLQQKIAGEFVKVKMPLWSQWVKSDRGVPGFVLDRSVDSLETPAVYRVVVDYRWYNAAGKRIATAIKRTAACRQRAVPPVVTPAS